MASQKQDSMQIQARMANDSAAAAQYEIKACADLLGETLEITQRTLRAKMRD